MAKEEFEIASTGAEGTRPGGLFSGPHVWLPAVVVVYALSIIPAYVAVLVLRSRGIDLIAPFQTFYWPVIWILDNVEWARRLNSLIEPALRRIASP